MLKIEEISKSFSQQPVLNQCHLELKTGEIGVLMGRSGSGKSTLLRIIAGLETPDHGKIWIDNASITEQTPVADRGVGLMFQNFALFPHLNVAQNVELAVRNLSKPDKKIRIEEMLELCEIQEQKNQFPHQLSGGQQQRLALARALASRPKILLMDEPLSQLDPELRLSLAQDLRRLLKRLGQTTLIVTHHLSEMYRLADRCGVLVQHKIPQWDSPKKVYREPLNSEVARFLDSENLVSVDVDSNDRVTWLGLKIPIEFPKSSSNPSTHTPTPSRRHLVRLPSHSLRFSTQGIPVKVIDELFMGGTTRYKVLLENNQTLTVDAPTLVAPTAFIDLPKAPLSWTITEE